MNSIGNKLSHFGERPYKAWSTYQYTFFVYKCSISEYKLKSKTCVQVNQYICYLFYEQNLLWWSDFWKFHYAPLQYYMFYIKKSGKVKAIRKFLMSIVRVLNYKSIEDFPPYFFFYFIGTNMIFWRIMMTRFYLYVSISMKRRVSIKTWKDQHYFFYLLSFIRNGFFFVKIYWIFHGKK